MAVCSSFFILIASSNSLAAALNEHNGPHGVRNRAAGQNV
jgi:hypothetical protein